MKKIVPILLTGVLALGVIPFNLASADDLTDKKNQLEYVKDQMKEAQLAIQQINAQSSEVSQEAKKIDDLVMATELEILQIEERIKIAEGSLVTLNYEKELLTKKLEDAKAYFKEKTFNTVAQSEGDKGDYIDYVISADSVDSLNYRLIHLNNAYSIYKNAVQLANSEQVYSKSKEGTVLLEKQQLEKDRQIVEKKRQFVQDQLDKKVAMFGQLQAEKQHYEHATEELEGVSEEITDVIRKLQASRASSGRVIVRSGNGQLGWPSATSERITSKYGMRLDPVSKKETKLHGGLDIGAKKGTGVLAAENGEVIHSGWLGGYGYAVIVDHGEGMSTLYGHNSKLNVKVGQAVKRGQQIAEVGSTGNSTGPHIHFEVRINGKRVDPLPYL